MRRPMLGLAVGLASVFGLAAPAHAQLFGAAPPRETRGETYVGDASAIPLQSVVACYVTIAVGEDHPEVRIHDEKVTRPLLAALAARIDGDLRRAGQPGDAASVASPLRAQVLANWDLGRYFKMRDKCQVAVDAGLVRFRTAAGGQDALNCLAYLATRSPADPDRALLEFDLLAAIDSTGTYYASKSKAVEGARDEVAAVLAGPNAAQLDATFTGCAPKVRTALRRIAYGRAPAIVYSDSVLVSRMRNEMDGALLKPIPEQESLGRRYWDVPATAWTKWVELPEAGNALACAHEYPLRAGRAKGALSPVDLAEKLLVEGGVAPADADIVIAAVMSDGDTFNSVTGLDDACSAWGATAARRYGASFFRGSELKTD